jgi:hypothetical protein
MVYIYAVDGKSEDQILAALRTDSVAILIMFSIQPVHAHQTGIFFNVAFKFHSLTWFSICSF